jgi:hypothetical protein
VLLLTAGLLAPLPRVERFLLCLVPRLAAKGMPLIQWIQDPQAVEPGTAMPNLGVDEAIARDTAAYLYTLPLSRFPTDCSRRGAAGPGLALELPFRQETATRTTSQSQAFRRAPW